MDLTRRDFIGKSAAGLGVFCFGPSLLHAGELPIIGARPEETDNDRILVLLQMSGGNDGLSTVVPYGNDEYYRNRRRTKHDRQNLLRIDDAVGLHPNLRALKELYDEGDLAIIQGAGYPNPNRSHFKSLDIWHAADHRGRNKSHGWIGALADAEYVDQADPNLIVHVGARVPYSLHAAINKPVAFTAPQAYKWVGAQRDAMTLEAAAPICEHMPNPAEAPKRSRTPHKGRDAALARLRRVLHEAQGSSTQVREAANDYRPKAKYPGTPLAAQLATVAALISGGLSTKVYSVEMGGFDTHNNQKNRHDNLMNQLGSAVGAFMKDLKAHGQSKRVVVMAFSEFGRRVKENASGGTDHGVAGPMFVAGEGIKGGLYGKYPSLTRLDKGDLIHTVDFRSVYATVIDDWLACDHKKALGKSWKKLGFIDRRAI